MFFRRLFVFICALVVASSPDVMAWGERGHQTVNRAAVRAIPDDGPAFLRAHEDWIVHLATIPDSWRRPSEPFLKILEDPNHGWFREQFAFMTDVPRSRYEFVLALDAEHRRLTAAGDTQAAALTNIRWTGTLPYAAVESYERMVAGMRRYRDARAKGGDTRLVELEIASYLGRLGHYIADGAQPLHDSVHHDGWQGENPHGYATDPRVHGRFESQFVDAMALTSEDIQKDVPAASVLADAFDAVLAHLDDAAALNNIVAVYGRDDKPRYPAIDAVSYDVTSPAYGRLVNTTMGVLEEESSEWALFYEPTLSFALNLLDVNRRDEAGRFEPLHLGENAAAFRRVASVAWSDYPYTVIIVPGAGADRPEVALNPQGKMRLALAARRYHERKAPFLLVSGGYVHPNQTKFNEAWEMKRSLMQDFDVPEEAILIDPHARHATTNLRNAARIMFRYGNADGARVAHHDGSVSE